MNRNAARHLALVVSILLCFFVYMGYRFWGTHDAEAESAPSSDLPVDIADSLPGLTAPDGNAGAASGLRPPETSDVSIPLTPPGSGISLAPPPSSPTPAPVGSIEETTTANAAASASSGSITGLIPAPPTDSGSAASEPASAAPNGLSLMPPPGGSIQPPAGTTQPSTGTTGVVPPPPSSESAQPSDRAASRMPPPPANGGTTGQQPIRPANADTAPVRPSSQQAASEPVARPATAPTPPVGGNTNASRFGNDGEYDEYEDDEYASPAIPSRTQANQPVGPSASESLRVYVIQPGDTLSRIATRELGSISLADNIYLLNRDVINDPDHLMVGVRIRLPMRESLGTPLPPGSGLPVVPPERPSIPVGTATAGRGRVHRVMRGETLSSISLRFYGTSAGWRGIYEANRNVLANPNQLQVGMELVIPPYSE